MFFVKKGPYMCHISFFTQAKSGKIWSMTKKNKIWSAKFFSVPPNSEPSLRLCTFLSCLCIVQNCDQYRKKRYIGMIGWCNPASVSRDVHVYTLSTSVQSFDPHT